MPIPKSGRKTYSQKEINEWEITMWGCYIGAFILCVLGGVGYAFLDDEGDWGLFLFGLGAFILCGGIYNGYKARKAKRWLKGR